MSIFRNYAPLYWAVGLPVVPLRVKQKAPIPEGWQRYSSTMPDEQTQAFWLDKYHDGNIGLPLGPQSGMVAIDLDTDDEKVVKILGQLLPTTPWVRRGMKGAVFMFKDAGHRTFRIKDMQGKTILECLAKGTQVVLPPSIHPDTGMPYVATGELYEMKDSLPPLMRDIETLLRQALIEAGIQLSTRGSSRMVEWVAAGARDSSMVSIAGIEARAVMRGERTLSEAFGEIETWISTFTEQVAGDSLDPVKGRQKIIEFIKRDIYEGKKALPPGWDDNLLDEEKAHARREFGEDNEAWTLERTMTFLENQFETHDRYSVGRRRAVEDAIMRISKSNMGAIDKETVVQYISTCSGRTITVGALRKRLRELEQGEIIGEDHTEVAQLLIKELERYGPIRWFGDKFWQWGGSHWNELPDGQVMAVIAREFGHMQAVRKYNDHRGVLRVMQNLVPKGLKTSHVQGLNFANGFLTTDLKLLPHEATFGATSTLPYIYDPARAKAPQRFLSFLFQCWGEDDDYEDKVKGLQQAIAATLFGAAPHFQRAFCLFGMPSSGKSVLLRIVLGLLPENTVCGVPPHDWSDKFLPTEMFGKLANACGELSENEMISGDRFKSIVDGEEMNGQFKNRDIFRFKPMCAHWFATNHLPRTRDSSSGFTRRWLFLHFKKKVSDKDKIVGLHEEILAEERDAIAAWAVEAMPGLLADNDYTLTKTHERLVLDMAGLNNSVRFFLTASGRVSLAESEKVRIPETELHTAYWSFCRTVAYAQPVALKTFRLRMQEMEDEFGFRLSIEKTPNGIEVAQYLKLTLARD